MPLDGTLTDVANAVLSRVAAGELSIDAGARLLAAVQTGAEVREYDEMQRELSALKADLEDYRSGKR